MLNCAFTTSPAMCLSFMRVLDDEEDGAFSTWPPRIPNLMDDLVWLRNEFRIDDSEVSMEPGVEIRQALDRAVREALHLFHGCVRVLQH